jgi:hypothetical protein
MKAFGEIGRLNQPELASYDWGRYQISLSRLSAYHEGRFLVKVLGGLAAGVGTWETPNEFRSLVALTHEIAHYKQDVTTGVGHWDFVKRRRFTPSALGDFLYLTWVPGQATEIREQGREKLRALGSDSLFNAYVFRDERALATIKKAFQDFAQYSEGEELKFTLPRLLEFDAVLSAWSAVTNLRFSHAADEIRAQNREFYSPFYMSGDYAETFHHLLQVFVHLMGLDADSSREEVDRTVSLFEGVAPMLIDFALAYPPPSYFEGRESWREHFEPGVRLVRTLRAFQREGEYDAERAEKSLVLYLDDLTRRTDEFEYPPVAQIYADWAEYFRRNADGDPIADWRREMCEQRVSDPGEFAVRGMVNFAAIDLPLFLQVEGARDNFIYATRRMVGDAEQAFYLALQANQRDLSLLDLFLGTGARHYVCPLASKNGPGMCEVQQDICLKGIEDVKRLPLSSECLVREGLRAAGFNLSRLAGGDDG